MLTPEGYLWHKTHYSISPISPISPWEKATKTAQSAHNSLPRLTPELEMKSMIAQNYTILYRVLHKFAFSFVPLLDLLVVLLPIPQYHLISYYIIYIILYHIFVYVCKHIYIFIYTHLYIHTHTPLDLSLSLSFAHSHLLAFASLLKDCAPITER